jgi:hypothetical protein
MVVDTGGMRGAKINNGCTPNLYTYSSEKRGGVCFLKI